MDWNDNLIQQLLQLCQCENYLVAEHAVGILSGELLANDWVQTGLFTDFDSKSYLRKRKILRQLMQAPWLHPELEFHLAEGLATYSGSLVKDIFKLMAIHKPQNERTESVIAELLDHENESVAREAYQYLNQTDTENKRIKKLLKRYRSNGISLFPD